jgi:hypothetical protein
MDSCSINRLSMLLHLLQTLEDVSSSIRRCREKDSHFPPYRLRNIYWTTLPLCHISGVLFFFKKKYKFNIMDNKKLKVSNSLPSSRQSIMLKRTFPPRQERILSCLVAD